jgi:ribosome-associated translation inhibitor RaiA
MIDMPVPTEITFRGMDSSQAVEDAVRAWVSRLEHYYNRIERCSVVIEIPHRHQRTHNTFQVHLILTVPDRTIAISRDPGSDQGHEDVYVALAHAFHAARRQLQEHARVIRGDVKAHA